MLPPLSVDQVILLVAAVQSLAFSLLLVAGSKGRRRSNELLAALLFCVAASLGDSLVASLGLAARGAPISRLEALGVTPGISITRMPPAAPA